MRESGNLRHREREDNHSRLTVRRRPAPAVQRRTFPGAWTAVTALSLLAWLVPLAAKADGADCAPMLTSAPPGRQGAALLFSLDCPETALRHSVTFIENAPRVTGPEQQELARALNDAAVISEKLGRYTDALRYYERVTYLPKSWQNTALDATIAANRAALHYRMGAYAEAVTAYNQALQVLDKDPAADPAAVAATLGGLGLVEQTLGRYDAAQAHLEGALALDEQRLGPMHPDVAPDLSNLGDLYRSRGDFNRVLPLYQRALAIRRAALAPDHADTANSLNKLAYALENLGQHEPSLLLSRQALAMRERVLPAGHPFIASAQSSIGDTLRRLNRLDEARPYYERALAIRRAALPVGHADIADTLHHLGWLKELSGDLTAAETHYREALAIREQALGTGHARTAETMARLGSVLAATGRTFEALALQQRAFAIAQASGVPEVQFHSGVLLAARYQARGMTPQAVFIGKLAVNAMQRIRSQSRTLDPALQRSWLQENSGAYRELAGWLVDLGRIAEAEQVLAMLKEVELADLVQRSDLQRTQADWTGGEQAAARTGDALTASGVAQSSELAALQTRQRAGEKLADTDRDRVVALRRQQVQWQIDFEQWVSSLKETLATTQVAGADLLNRGTDLQTLVRPDPGALGLSYIVGQQRLAIVVATGRGSFGREVPVGRLEINRLVAALRQAIDTRADVMPAARALYRVLIEPVATDIAAANATTLVLSLTESLRYLPFAALHDGQQYLVERYALANWLQAGGTPAGAAPSAWHVAGLGAAQGSAGFKPLPAVPGELARIVRDSKNPGGALPGKVLLDAAFNRNGLDEALSGRFNVVHIASHFDFRPGDPIRSVLLLGDGNTVSLRELAAMDYLNVQLLTLSACNTASGGGINENGAEVEGLAAAVRRQGARSVLASLWPVADASTAALMQRFYTARDLNRASALRDAQLTLLRGSAQAGTSAEERSASALGVPVPQTVAMDPARPWAHPYFLAPFTLSGDWL